MTNLEKSVEELKKEMADVKAFMSFLDTKSDKRLDLDRKQVELAIRREENKQKFSAKEKIYCLVAVLAFLLGCYTVHEHFNFLKTSLVEETKQTVENTVEASDLSHVNGSQIGTITISK